MSGVTTRPLSHPWDIPYYILHEYVGYYGPTVRPCSILWYHIPLAYSPQPQYYTWYQWVYFTNPHSIQAISLEYPFTSYHIPVSILYYIYIPYIPWYTYIPSLTIHYIIPVISLGTVVIIIPPSHRIYTLIQQISLSSHYIPISL